MTYYTLITIMLIVLSIWTTVTFFICLSEKSNGLKACTFIGIFVIIILMLFTEDYLRVCRPTITTVNINGEVELVGSECKYRTTSDKQFGEWIAKGGYTIRPK